MFELNILRVDLLDQCAKFQTLYHYDSLVLNPLKRTLELSKVIETQKRRKVNVSVSLIFWGSPSLIVFETQTLTELWEELFTIPLIVLISDNKTQIIIIPIVPLLYFWQTAGGWLSDIDECNDGVHNCHINANCSDTIDSYDCQCLAGWLGNGSTCDGEKGTVDAQVLKGIKH